MNCQQVSACTNRCPPVPKSRLLVLTRWTLVLMHPPVSDMRPLVLTSWTLVLIHDNGSAQDTGAPFLKGKTGHSLKQAVASSVQVYASLKQTLAACLQSIILYC